MVPACGVLSRIAAYKPADMWVSRDCLLTNRTRLCPCSDPPRPVTPQAQTHAAHALKLLLENYEGEPPEVRQMRRWVRAQREGGRTCADWLAGGQCTPWGCCSLGLRLYAGGYASVCSCSCQRVALGRPSEPCPGG